MKQLDVSPRAKYNRIDVHFYIYPDVRDKIDVMCKEHKQPRGQILESLLKFFEDNR